MPGWGCWPGKGRVPASSILGRRDAKRCGLGSLFLAVNSPRQGGDYGRGQTWGGHTQTGHLWRLVAGRDGAEQTLVVPEEAET